MRMMIIVVFSQYFSMLNEIVMRTLIAVIFVIVKVRLGSDEEHREWDVREKLRSRLENAAEEVLGENYGIEDAVDKWNFFYTLLCDDAVIDALRKVEKDSSFGSVSCCCCFGHNEAEEELAALIIALWVTRRETISNT